MQSTSRSTLELMTPKIPLVPSQNVSAAPRASPQNNHICLPVPVQRQSSKSGNLADLRHSTQTRTLASNIALDSAARTIAKQSPFPYQGGGWDGGARFANDPINSQFVACEHSNSKNDLPNGPSFFQINAHLTGLWALKCAYHRRQKVIYALSCVKNNQASSK